MLDKENQRIEMIIFLSKRLEVADTRLKQMEEYPILNKIAIDKQVSTIALHESNIERAIRGY